MSYPGSNAEHVERLRTLSRRELFRRGGMGLGSVALTWMLNQESRGGTPPGPPMAVKPSHFAPRAKNVIFLHMTGGPSHVDLLDPKPALRKFHGQPVPQAFIEGSMFGFITGRPELMDTRYRFDRYGRAGTEVSELLPHLGRIVDDVAVVRGMHTDEFNHANAQLLMHTGFRRVGRPGIGSWVTYGIGSANQNLPGFVVLTSGTAVTNAGTSLWSSGFLPTSHQGVEFRNAKDPILHLSNPAGMTHQQRGEVIGSVGRLNRARLAAVGDPEIDTRIAQYELAYRMQTSVPDLMDISDEPPHVLAMYGVTPGKPDLAQQCLLARRMVERGVRFVQLYVGGWDHHQKIFSSLPEQCREIDRPAAALVTDLKQRGLLDETLVVWGGEFGRTPMVQEFDPDGGKGEPGRDHHKDAFSLWMAGGGIKPGIVHGVTDEFGCRVVADAVHVHDLQATLLHLLGLDHERLTYRYTGRDFRLTDVHGKVVKELLA